MKYKNKNGEIIAMKKSFHRINRTRIADYNGIRLVEPNLESGVFTIFMQLSTYNPDIFPFVPLDYDTHSGVSVGRFSPFRVGLKTPISVNLKSPMHHVCY